jgi:hypothetical protein
VRRGAIAASRTSSGAAEISLRMKLSALSASASFVKTAALRSWLAVS